MGEVDSTRFEPDFNRSLKVEFNDERITSNAGVVLLRETDHRLDLLESIVGPMYDRRDPHKIRYSLLELFRERVYAMAMGYSAQDDPDRLAHDPAFRIAVWDRLGEGVLDERLATRSDAGRRCRDTFMGLKKTCRKLGFSFGEFLFDRLSGAFQIPRLSELMPRAAASKTDPAALDSG